MFLFLGVLFWQFILTTRMGFPWFVALVPNIVVQALSIFTLLRFAVFKEHKTRNKDSNLASSYVSFIVDNSEDIIVDYIDNNAAIFFQIRYGDNTKEKEARLVSFIESIYLHAIQDNLIVKSYTTYEEVKERKSYKEFLKGISNYNENYKRIMDKFVKLINGTITEETEVITDYFSISTNFPSQRKYLESLPNLIRGESKGTNIRELTFLDSEGIKRLTKRFLNVSSIDFSEMGDDTLNLPESVKLHSVKRAGQELEVFESIFTKYSKQLGVITSNQKCKEDEVRVLNDIENPNETIFGRGITRL